MTDREESHNPALAEEPFEPVEETYRVIAKTRVMGHDTGEEFTAALNEMEIDSLVGSHLEVVTEGHKVGKGRGKTAANKKDAEDTDTDGDTDTNGEDE
jgi:hypothetical protein